MPALPVHAARPDLDALELLVAVGDLGSLSAAAGALGIAQPNASRTLSRLERRLGARLIDRGSRGSEPTAAGRVALEHARRVLDATDDLVEQVRTAAGEGRVRIIASQTVAERLMPVFLAALAADLPGVPASFEVDNSSGVLAAVRRGRADIGFVEGAEEPAGLGSLVIGRDRLVAVVAPTHAWARDPQRRRDGVDAAQLAATPLVVREEGSGTREVLRQALAPRPLAEPALVLHSNAAVRTAVAGGAGPAVLSELIVDADLREGTLVSIPVRGVALHRLLRVVWNGPRPARLDGALQALLDAQR
ncbi:LysR family transcriptional regulator [Brachybacterium phenoliresistens]|uniref:LysR family transcriptional regulator n=1 Tax=Brachybacterium phenoliresistens TaxID=396014 RepID=Z9JYI2_9MICO|nr:LysR family transcriptional regulator [Brachybacterium phenoliresistens]EWS83038.1 LysR family transcriptional regulator [Brachybacterium phenoliresistens]